MYKKLYYYVFGESLKKLYIMTINVYYNLQKYIHLSTIII